MYTLETCNITISNFPPKATFLDKEKQGRQCLIFEIKHNMANR